jgi:GTPase SAR1 family protein
LDTAGQQEFKSFRDVTAAFADGFLVIFSLIAKDTMEEAKSLANEMRDSFRKPVVVAGNKMVQE